MKKNIFPEIKVSFLIFLLTLTFFNFNLNPAQAVVPTAETASVPQILRNVWDKLEKSAEKWYKTYGAKLIGTTIRNTLNRVALNAASYVASAGMGQKPTFVVEDFGTYWKNIGDAAAGDFIDGLGKSWNVDLCQPPSADLQAKIGLGLVQTLEPAKPNCTLSQLSSNYASAWEKLTAMTTGDFVKSVQVSFEPGVSELSGAFTLFGRTKEASTKAAEEEKTKNTITEGWLDVRNIAGKAKTAPGTAKDKLEQAQDAQTQNLLTTTGDALVDAANTFLNQLAYEAFQKILQSITQGAETSQPLDTNALTNRVSSGFTALIQYGESIVGEKMASVIKPRFDVRGDYDILSELAICPNKENPGPNNCVIDDKFSQAISEKMTVGEALKSGYLHGDWLVTTDSKAESAYTLRSASILRKYRILPIGWEEAISKASEKGYKVTLQDLVYCFDDKEADFSSGFNKSDLSWCKGLVDPNWVLKAPLNYCAKQGYSSQIISSFLSQDENGFPILAISRGSDYCADEKSCIKEKVDGSCELYGYCNEEKRVWKFDSDSCEPVYNTCQTFVKKDGDKTASYLQNTLDFSTCDSNNVGCQQYSYFGAYNINTGQVSWNGNYGVFFNNKIANCDASNEGCSEFLRGKSGWRDVNYIMNSDFGVNSIGESSYSNSWSWPIKNGSGEIVYEDSKALLIKGNSPQLYSNDENSLLPSNLNPINGWSYTLSAQVKIKTGSKVSMFFGDSNKPAEVTGSGWQTLSVSASGLNNLNFSISGVGSTEFYVRNLKLTPNSFDAGFSDYAAFPVYQKLLPNYLENVCYEVLGDNGGYSLKPGAPDICNNYARKCSYNDVGCDSFSSVKDNFTVAAKANITDYCDAQCIGYDTYLARESYFYNTSADNLIPDNAKECSAEESGCASFTNLDKVVKGGEAVEYYTKIKQCIKPSATSCADFYSWDDSQLKVMSLRKKVNGDLYLVDENLASQCTAEIYNLPPSDPRYNSDCREFYSKNGKISYALLSNTVTCSENCYPYRLNETNIDKTLSMSSCVGSDKKWDPAQSACYVCKNGGVWDDSQKACLYNAIPDEGIKCSSQSVGCREYNGNNGNNLRIMATYSFDSGSDGFYSLQSSENISLNSDSIYKNGKSLNIYSGVGVDVSNFVKRGSSYIIKFLAKTSGPAVSANFYFENAKGEKANFNVTKENPQGNVYIKNDGSWNVYEINLKELNHEINLDSLKIKTNSQILVDNIVITEITERYYLIRNSGTVPDVCFYDVFNAYQGPNYNLGCSQYKDRSGALHNLHQFSSLCSDSAVGCEQMIKTNNHSQYYGKTFNLNSSDINSDCGAGSFGCLKVPGHEAVYMIFDPSKQCNKSDVGCSRFGSLQTSSAANIWVDAYKKNLPDSYSDEKTSPLCSFNEVGCSAWAQDDKTEVYFKDPGLNTCVFKDGTWYKSQVRRCDNNNNGKIEDLEKTGKVCSSNSDCAGGANCIIDTNNYTCEVDYLKTIGYGGTSGRIPVPKDAVGICSSDASGCTEYIDPISKNNENLLINPGAEDLDKDGDFSNDRWIREGNFYYQMVSIKPNTLYTASIDVRESESGSLSNTLGITGSIKLGTPEPLYVLKKDNKLYKEDSRKDSQFYYFSSEGGLDPLVFYSGPNTVVKVVRDKDSVNNKNSSNAFLRKFDITAIFKESTINYQLKDGIDTSSCNGLVDVNKGCILFNVRSQNGASGLKGSIFDASLTSDGSAPKSCVSGSDRYCNTNQVIKVSLDRVCSKWLSCQTYIEDPVTKEKTCYLMGECDQLNDKNECSNFLSASSTILSKDVKGSNNATGYSLLNNYNLGAMKEVGHNTDAHFDFEDVSVNLTCVRNIGVSGNLLEYSGAQCNFDRNINDSLILDPKSATTDYPANGKGYLKVLGYYQISPMSASSSISVFSNQDYYINYLINTRESGLKTKLIITDEKNQIITTFIEEAPSGWERKVNRFRITSPKTEAKKIKIYLTSNANTTNNAYVYFDDINIEPVLKINNDSFVAKSCRLYPGEDSLTCLSANNNVIKDGLFGYCLQSDPLNKDVCLMWYPVDKISPITRNTQSVLGYSGKFPLNYCAEVNGDFTLVEKRVGNLQAYIAKNNKNISSTLSEINATADKISDGTLGCSDTQTRAEDYLGQCTSQMRGNACSSVIESAEIESDSDCRCLEDQPSMELCGSTDYTAIIYLRAAGDRWLFDGPKTREVLVYCAPKKGDNIFGSVKEVDFRNYHPDAKCSFRIKEGWWEYNGLFNKPSITIIDASVAKITDSGRADIKGLNEGENNKTNGLSAVMVYDNKNKSEESLKHIYNQNPDDVYRLTCNRFVQLVDNSGKNAAWSDRISRNNIATTTPTYLGKAQGYIRNREDVPFGASILPNNFDFLNSGAIPLRNQYSKKVSESALAGRPYGCTGSGCDNIGQCSLDPNVFCFYRDGDDDFNKLSCSAGGNGSCMALWGYEEQTGRDGGTTTGRDGTGRGRDAEAIVPSYKEAIGYLNQLFMEKYVDYSYSQETKSYQKDDKAEIFTPLNEVPICTPGLTKICKKLPIIRNVKLVKDNIVIQPSSKTINITEGGVYQLSFNTEVDKEQQPLNQIVINWGDSSQIITGVDHRPETANPHVVNHFYLRGQYNSFNISIFDNWQAYKDLFN